jgi:hypothetical protein
MNIFRAPFLFLMIRFQGRWTYILALPLLTALVLTALTVWLGSKVSVLGPSGLFTKLLAIMPIAGGFFVAALTVILSQSNSILQAGFVGDNKPVLVNDDEPMTRQRFLALLFGYLSFSSFTIAGILAGTDFIAPALRTLIEPSGWLYAKVLTTFGVLFWTSQMFWCSMIGLFYLTDRLYRSTGVAKFRKDLPTVE